MTEKFVVVIYGEDDSQTLGLMNVKSGEIEYLPALPENIYISYSKDHGGTYCATGYSQNLCFLAKEYRDPDNYVYSLVKYNDQNKEYSIGMSNVASALCANLGLSDDYAFIKINNDNFSFTDPIGKWIWFELEGFIDQTKLVVSVNIETFEIAVIAELEYLAQTYFSHEIATYVTKDSLVKLSGYKQPKLYSREDTSFPILDGFGSAVLGVSDDHKKILAHGVDGDDWQASIVQVDLITYADTVFLDWYSTSSDIEINPDKGFITSADASEVVWLGSEIRWIGDGGVLLTHSLPEDSYLSGQGITYTSQNTNDIFINIYNDSIDEYYSEIIHRDGTVTDLRSVHPNSGDIEAICTWDNAPLSPQMFWTQFNQTEEVIEG